MALITNLVSYWKLDESSGNAADAHGSNTMVNVGTMAYSAGKINNAADTVNTGKYLTISNASQVGLDIITDVSFSLWVKTSENSKTILGFFGAGADGYGLGMGTIADKPIGVAAARLGDGWIAGTSRIDDGIWHHIVCTLNGTTAKIYVDGVLENTITVGAAISYTGDRDIGRRLTTYLSAQIDEVGIWSRALSASEVTELYNSGAGFQYPFLLGNPNFLMFM